MSQESEYSLEIFMDKYNQQIEILSLSMQLLKSSTEENLPEQNEKIGTTVEQILEAVEEIAVYNLEAKNKISNDFEKLTRIQELITSQEVEELIYGQLPNFSDLRRSVDSLSKVVSHTEQDFANLVVIDEIQTLTDDIESILNDAEKMLAGTNFEEKLPIIKSAKLDGKCGGRKYRNGEKLFSNDGDVNLMLKFKADKLPFRLISFEDIFRLSLTADKIVLVGLEGF